jgi:hypothetical protein
VGGSFASYVAHVISSSKVLYKSLSIHSWTRYIVFCFFALGCFWGLKKNFLITLYLLLVFAGQLFFSTYMTYVTIPWFAQRYLVASYVAFALICALGAEALFRQLGGKFSVVFVTLLLVAPMFNAVESYFRSLNETSFNAATFVIENVRCDDRKTLVLSDPDVHNAVYWYAYRNDSDIITPFHSNLEANLNAFSEAITNAFSERYCIVLLEVRQSSYYSGAFFNKLSDLPGYSKKQLRAKPGPQVPKFWWLFTPN